MSKNNKNEGIQILVNAIAKLTNNVTSEQEAQNLGLTHYLSFDNSTTYGGYRLNYISVKGGGHSDIFNGLISDCKPRLNYTEFEQFLKGIIIGININR